VISDEKPSEISSQPSPPIHYPLPTIHYLLLPPHHSPPPLDIGLWTLDSGPFIIHPSLTVTLCETNLILTARYKSSILKFAMLGENVMVTAGICFLVTLLELLSAYILHKRTTNFYNAGDTRIQPHRGDDGILRLRQAFLEWRYSRFALGLVPAIWPVRRASCLRNVSAGCDGGNDGTQK